MIRILQTLGPVLRRGGVRWGGVRWLVVVGGGGWWWLVVEHMKKYVTM